MTFDYFITPEFDSQYFDIYIIFYIEYLYTSSVCMFFALSLNYCNYKSSNSTVSFNTIDY